MGIASLTDLAEADPEELASIRGVSPEQARDWVRRAQRKRSDRPPRPTEKIPGIGPTYSQRLRDEGIANTKELGLADPAELASIRGVSEQKARRWVQKAREYQRHESLSRDTSGDGGSGGPEVASSADSPNTTDEAVGSATDGDTEDLDPTTAPRSLHEIRGVGEAYEERLKAAGIHDTRTLAESTPKSLARQVDVGEARLAGWVADARSYHRGSPDTWIPEEPANQGLGVVAVLAAILFAPVAVLVALFVGAITLAVFIYVILPLAVVAIFAGLALTIAGAGGIKKGMGAGLTVDRWLK